MVKVIDFRKVRTGNHEIWSSWPMNANNDRGIMFLPGFCDEPHRRIAVGCAARSGKGISDRNFSLTAGRFSMLEDIGTRYVCHGAPEKLHLSD